MDAKKHATTAEPQVINLEHGGAVFSEGRSGKSGFAVRCDLHAGQWQCRSCQGEVKGDRMFNPNCSYCRYT